MNIHSASLFVTYFVFCML